MRSLAARALLFGDAMRSLLLSMLVVFALVGAARAEPGHVPKLLITTDWGAQMLYGDNMDASGGLMVTVRHPRTNVILYGEGRTLFLGGNFSGRFGMILGKGYVVAKDDIHIHSISQGVNAQGQSVTRYSGTTTTFHGQQIRGVVGLALSASASTFGYGDGSNAQLEAGLGMCGQHCGELQYITDPVNDGQGFRFAFTYSAGTERDFHLAFRIAAEGLWGNELPSYGIVTFGVGGGSGYHWRQ